MRVGGGGLYMCRFWLAAHTFFPFMVCQQNPWPGTRNQARAKGAELSPGRPVPKCFYWNFILFHWILMVSLSVPGSTVMESLRPANSDCLHAAMQAKCVCKFPSDFSGSFGKCRRAWGWDVPLYWGVDRVSGWRENEDVGVLFVVIQNYTRTLCDALLDIYC